MVIKDCYKAAPLIFRFFRVFFFLATSRMAGLYFTQRFCSGSPSGELYNDSKSDRNDVKDAFSLISQQEVRSEIPFVAICCI